jgi:hypothetical protein
VRCNNEKGIINYSNYYDSVFFCFSGNKGEKAVSSGDYRESGLENVNGNKVGEAQGNETDEQAKPGKIKESELPKEYRTDLVPIFKGAEIFAVEEDPDHRMYALGCYTKKPYKEVKAFYKKIMSNYKINSEQENNDPDSYDPMTYYVDGYINDTVAVAISVVDVSEEDLDEWPDAPKDAKTVFGLTFHQLKDE